MSVDLKGFNANLCTLASSGATSGSPVKLSSSLTVSDCASGETFAGFCDTVRNSYATVQLCGYRRVSYSGTAPSVGYATLAADGSGGVKTVSTGGRSILVTDVDTTGKTVGIIL